MATQISSPGPKPFIPPTLPSHQGGPSSAPSNPAAIPSPGTLTIPPQIERQTTDVFSPSNASKAPPSTPTNGAALQFGSKHAQPKFSGGLRTAAAVGLGGIAAISAAVCLPAAAVTGLVGLFIHPLLPLAGILALVPVGLGGLAFAIGKSGGK